MGFLESLKDFWSRQSRNFKVLLVRDIINRLLGNIAGPYSTIYFKLLGAGAVEIGLLNSISSIVRMMLSIPSGLLTDRVKRLKSLYIIGRVLSLPISLIYAFAQSWHIFLVTRVWGTIAGRLTMPVMNIISIESLSNRDRVSGLAIRRTITSAVGLVAPMLGAYLITYFGGLGNENSFRPLFIIQFLVGLTTFLLLLFYLAEPKIERTRTESGILRSTIDIFKEFPGLKRFLLLNAINSFFSGIRQPFRILYFYEIKNANAFILGLQGTISTAITLMLSVPMSKFTDKIGRKRSAYISQGIYALCVLSALLTPQSIPMLLLLYSFFSALGGTFRIGWDAFQQEYIPLEVRGRWSGISTLIGALISIPAPIIGGILWNLNPDYAWILGIIHYVFITIPIMMTIPEKKEKTS